MSAELVALAQQALLLALVLVLPVIVATFVAGVVAALLGAFLQLSDPSVALALRLVAVAAAIAMFSPAMVTRLVSFARAVMAVVERGAGG